MGLSSRNGRRLLLALALCMLPLGVIAADAPAAGDAVMIFSKDSTAGKNWVAPKSDNNTLVVDEKAGKDGVPALHFHGEGAGWFGAGWNWCGWWPADAGNDISAKKNLHFWVKGKTAGDDKGVAFTVALASSNAAAPDKPGKTGAVNIADYVAKWADGEWHEITIPLADLDKGAKAESKLDAAKAWELDIGSWAQDDRKLDVWLSDIGFTGAK